MAAISAKAAGQARGDARVTVPFDFPSMSGY
jgi:hypothetical protein